MRPVRRSAGAAKVDTSSKREYAYQRLKAGILDGTYAPKERLIEGELSKALGISRNTLRAVLVRLEQEGLVQIEANRGARVRSFTVEEAIQILLVREVLEGLAASLAAQKASRAQVQHLQGIVEEMRRALAEGDALRYTSLNDQFHRAILEAAGHDLIRRLVPGLNFALIRYQFRTVLVPGRSDVSLAEHRQILTCIERGNAEGAEQATRHHVSQVRKTLQQVRDAANQPYPTGA
jgi:DNA-binding GntR family transcriptional regulator